MDARVALFVTHCGAGGVTEALFDQHMNAKRVEELGAGLMVQDRQELSDLPGLVERMLEKKRRRGASTRRR